MAIHPTLEHVTRRIQARSAPTRAAYLQRVDDASRAGPLRGALSCTNLAHGFAAAAKFVDQGVGQCAFACTGRAGDADDK